MPHGVDLFLGVAFEKFGELAAAFGIEVGGHFGGGIDGDRVHEPAMEKTREESFAGIGEIDPGAFDHELHGAGTDGMAGDAGESAGAADEGFAGADQGRGGRMFGCGVSRVTMQCGESHSEIRCIGGKGRHASFQPGARFLEVFSGNESGGPFRFEFPAECERSGKGGIDMTLIATEELGGAKRELGGRRCGSWVQIGGQESAEVCTF